MNVIVPDTIAEASRLTPETALLDVAIGIYKREQWSMGRCAKIVGMSRFDFLNELGKREIPINYDTDDLDQDIETMKSLFPEME
jgi:predicted HTH domain antitoxin